MKTILITGGAGFIGSAFTRMAVPDWNVKVVNLDKLTYAGDLDSLEPVAYAPDYVFVEGDIAEEVLVRDVLAEHTPAAVVNFAAETHVDRSIDAPRHSQRFAISLMKDIFVARQQLDAYFVISALSGDITSA